MHTKSHISGLVAWHVHIVKDSQSRQSSVDYDQGKQTCHKKKLEMIFCPNCLDKSGHAEHHEHLFVLSTATTSTSGSRCMYNSRNTLIRWRLCYAWEVLGVVQLERSISTSLASDTSEMWSSYSLPNSSALDKQLSVSSPSSRIRFRPSAALNLASLYVSLRHGW